jgi:predicted helicase
VPILVARYCDGVGAKSDQETFGAFADSGKRLANLHVEYEQQPEWPLARVEKGHLN